MTPGLVRPNSQEPAPGHEARRQTAGLEYGDLVRCSRCETRRPAHHIQHGAYRDGALRRQYAGECGWRSEGFFSVWRALPTELERPRRGLYMRVRLLGRAFGAGPSITRMDDEQIARAKQTHARPQPLPSGWWCCGSSVAGSLVERWWRRVQASADCLCSSVRRKKSTWLRKNACDTTAFGTTVSKPWNAPSIISTSHGTPAARRRSA